jgi:hypothetical protein
MPINTNQDNKRELVLIEMFGLNRISKNSRGLYDAIDDYGNIFELKSTSKSNVSTARDCGLKHIERWRKEYWIVGIWDCACELYKDIYFLSPLDLEDWIIKVEMKIKERMELMSKISSRINLNALEYKLLDNIIKRGCTLNDPSIPLTYIRDKGTLVNTKIELSSLVHKNPLVGVKNERVVSLEDFII